MNDELGGVADRRGQLSQGKSKNSSSAAFEKRTPFLYTRSRTAGSISRSIFWPSSSRNSPPVSACLKQTKAPKTVVLERRSLCIPTKNFEQLGDHRLVHRALLVDEARAPTDAERVLARVEAERLVERTKPLLLLHHLEAAEPDRAARRQLLEQLVAARGDVRLLAPHRRRVVLELDRQRARRLRELREVDPVRVPLRRRALRVVSIACQTTPSPPRPRPPSAATPPPSRRRPGARRASSPSAGRRPSGTPPPRSRARRAA